MMEKIKRYSKDQKEQIICEAEQVRIALKNQVFEKKSIPKTIINAPFSKIVEYKNNCEKVGSDRHVKGTLKSSWTGKKLLEVKAKLDGYRSLILAD